MAKSNRRYIFGGMEILQKAPTLFVERRLENALTGHCQAKAAQKVNGLEPDPKTSLCRPENAADV